MFLLRVLFIVAVVQGEHVEEMRDDSGYKTDVYFTEKEPDGSDWRDWVTPHYASSSWTDYLIWVTGWW
jgi:hypothetical protein